MQEKLFLGRLEGGSWCSSLGFLCKATDQRCGHKMGRHSVLHSSPTYIPRGSTKRYLQQITMGSMFTKVRTRLGRTQNE